MNVGKCAQGPGERGQGLKEHEGLVRDSAQAVARLGHGGGNLWENTYVVWCPHVNAPAILFWFDLSWGGLKWSSGS